MYAINKQAKKSRDQIVFCPHNRTASDRLFDIFTYRNGETVLIPSLLLVSFLLFHLAASVFKEKRPLEETQFRFFFPLIHFVFSFLFFIEKKTLEVYFPCSKNKCFSNFSFGLASKGH